MTDIIKSERYISEHRPETVENMCKLAATDTLLFWSADEEVYKRQQKIWQPFLDGFGKSSGAEVKISRNLDVPDNEQCFKVLKKRIGALSDKELTAVMLAALQLRSVILGLCILDEETEIDDIFAAAFLEELYQNEFWGTDEAVAAKRELIKKELHAIRDYLKK